MLACMHSDQHSLQYLYKVSIKSTSELKTVILYFETNYLCNPMSSLSLCYMWIIMHKSYNKSCDFEARCFGTGFRDTLYLQVIRLFKRIDSRISTQGTWTTGSLSSLWRRTLSYTSWWTPASTWRLWRAKWWTRSIPGYYSICYEQTGLSFLYSVILSIFLSKTNFLTS